MSQRTAEVERKVGPVVAPDGNSACGCCAAVGTGTRAAGRDATRLSVPGIVCGGCANAIRNALGGLEGVSLVEVDVAARIVAVSHDDRVSREALAGVLERAGFPAS